MYAGSGQCVNALSTMLISALAPRVTMRELIGNRGER